MYKFIPERLKKLANSMDKPLYAVGGVCRDFLAGLVSEHDWDICAPVRAEEFSAAAEACGFTVTSVYKNTGTVNLKADGVEYEYTCFRTDRYVRGKHSPEEIYFTEDIASDARRRDFKCNAVYYDIAAQKFVDPLGGIEDIKNGTLSTVDDASKVFGEDGLRLMRLCRIAAQTGFLPSGECMDGALKNCALIADIAPERIWKELADILTADRKYGVKNAQYLGLKYLFGCGVLSLILPELALGDKMYQRADFHDHDVLEHSLRCVMYAPCDLTLRTAALLHDIGKPYCKINFGKYARHEEEGERIAADVLKRLRAPKRFASRVCRLVALHMYDLSGQASENKVRKFIVNNLDAFDDLLIIKQADYSACKDDLSECPCVKKWESIYKKMVYEGVPLTLKALAVKGDELIASGICADETAKTLKFLLGECAIGNVPNDKGRLISYALARRGG